MYKYLQFKKHYAPQQIQDYKAAFLSYLQFGGFPVIHTADYSKDSAYQVIYDIYSSVILRDTAQRYKIRDVELLERVVKYVLTILEIAFPGKMWPTILRVSRESWTLIPYTIT